jgi:hemoglobin
MSQPSLYDKLGGEGAVRATIVKMYEKILSDERVSVFFANTDADKLRRMNNSFANMAFGNPSAHSAISLCAAHAPLVQKMGMNDTHFDIVAGHLADAMRELGMEEALIQEGQAAIESVRDAVMGRE